MEYKEPDTSLMGRPAYDRGREWAGNTGSRTGSFTFEKFKTTVADKLHAASQTLHQKAGQAERPTEFSAYGHRAADWLERSAEYVNGIEPERLRTDLTNQVRRNPGRSLLLAGVAGLVLGRVFRRR